MKKENELGAKYFSHFSLQVLDVQSAYKRAAGSSLARKPTKWGVDPSCEIPADTSERRDFAILAARTTLHDGGGWLDVAMVIR